ncbi:Putative ribonuclease H protein At1g65750 [Linum grandiflorum]
MKVAWGLLTRPDELWAKVLLTKYLRNTETGYVAAKTKGFSAVWRGIQRAGPILNEGTQWAIRSGVQTKFWTDKWLDSGVILINHALDIQGVSLNSSVSDFVLDNGLWNSSLIFTCLPSQIALQVLGMTPPSTDIGQDSIIWGLEPSGRFTIRSAYLLLKELQGETPEQRWKGVWNWQGPNKIRHFLWLASHNRLLTNEERGRRHLTNQVICSLCSTHTESCIHILRDCHFARLVWRLVLPQVITSEELSSDWSIWLDTHIRHREDEHSLIFGVAVWLLWRARNKRVFEQAIETPTEVAHRCDYWVALINSSWKTGQLGREVRSLTRQTQLIGWRPSNEGWFTLSTDGSLRSPTKLAAAGGVIRTDTGCFVKAFAANLGSCSITRAEMRAIVDGLQLAWSLGIRRIKVQSDSMSAISILAKVSELDHQHAALVLQFKELCSRQWDVHLSHIYREANYAADYLANLGHSFSYGLHLFDYPDRDLSHWLHYDLIGVSLPRLVRTPNNI